MNPSVIALVLPSAPCAAKRGRFGPQVPSPGSPNRQFRMTTVLDKTLKRQIDIQGRAYVVAISPEGFTLTVKGKRKGQTLRWVDLVTGEAAMAVALNASLEGLPREKTTPPPSDRTRGRPRRGKS